jgi:hypothetical protein
VGVTRRQILAASAAVAVASAAGAGAVAWQWWDRPPGAGYSWLSPDEVSIVEAFADALFPPGGEPSLAGADANLARWFDAVLEGMPSAKARELKLLLHALNNLARASGGSAFVDLDRADRAALNHRWLTSSTPEIRLAMLGLSTLIGCGYTTHPETAPYFTKWFGCRYGR